MAQSGNPLDPHCPSCGSGLSRGQRFCISCGARSGAAPVGKAEQGYVASGAAASGGFTLAGFGTRSLTAMAVSLTVCGAVIGAAFSPPPVDSLAAGNATTMAQAFPSGVTGGGTTGAPLLGGSGSAGSSFDTVQGNSSPTDLSNSTYDPNSSGYTAPDSGSGSSSTPAPPATPPNIGHVVVVMLPTGPDKTKATPEALARISASTTTGSAATAAAVPTLASRGVLFKGFRQVSGTAAGNGLALLSGQKANADFVSGCAKLTKLDDSVATVDKNGKLSTSSPGCLIDRDIKIGNLAEQVRSRIDGSAFAVYHDVASSTPSAHICERLAVGADVKSKHGDVTSLPANPTNWFESLRADSTACWNGTAKSGINRRLTGGSNSGLKFDLDHGKSPAVSFVLPDAAATAGTAAQGTFVSKVFKTVRHSKSWSDSLVVFVWDSQITEGAPASGAVFVSPFAKAGTTVAAKSKFDTFDLLAAIHEQIGLEAAGEDVLGYAKDSKYDPIGDSKKFRTLKPKPLGS